MNHPKLIIGISGASGIIYGIRLLEALTQIPLETHLIVSKAAQLTLAYETSLSLTALKKLAHYTYSPHDLSAPIASGSFHTLGMIIAPCSMKTLAEIAHGLSGTLLSRAADVVLKERRRLVVMPRETPLHLVHLQNMISITSMGGIIFPPIPAFYSQPQHIDDLVNDSIGRVLDLFQIENSLAKRWESIKRKKES